MIEGWRGGGKMAIVKTEINIVVKSTPYGYPTNQPGHTLPPSPLPPTPHLQNY